MAQSLGNLLVNISADTTQLVQGFNTAEKIVSKTTKQMTYAVKGLIGAFVGLNTLDIAKNFTKQLDLITSANNKLKLVTKTTEEYTTAQKELFKVAQITSSGYSETVTLYSKLSDSMLKMGKSQAEIFRTVETVNKAITLSGSTAQEASAAILQLGQAFGSGLLQGDELKSINENAQGLSKAIAEGMGVAVGQLKQLGSEGKITAQVLADALAKVSGSVDSNFSKMQKTIAQSSINISNAIQKIISDFDTMNGISKNMATIFNDIARYLESINSEDIQGIADTAETIGKVAISAGVLAVGVKTYNTAVQIATAYNALFAGSYGAVNSAIVLATASQVAFNKAVKLSAVGIAITAIYGLSESFIEAKKRSDNLSVSVEQLANNFEALELKARLVDVNKELKEMDKNIKGYNETQKMMYQGGYDLAYREKVQLEKAIALIDKKNEALKNGGNVQTPTNKTPLSDDVRNIITPSEVVIEKYAKLFQNLTESGKSTAENVALITKKMNEELANLDKDGVQKRKEAEKEKLKAVEDAENKRKELIKEATDLTISEVDKINAKYMEMYNVAYNTLGEEQKIAFLQKWQEEVEKANGTLDKQKEKQDLITQSLIIATDEVDLINQKYMEMYNVIDGLFNEEQMQKFFKKWQDEVDKTIKKQEEYEGLGSKEWASNLKGQAKNIADVSNAFEDINKEQKQWEKFSKDNLATEKDKATHVNEQLKGYSNLAGAISGMFEEGSREAAVFQTAQMALALVEGTRAVLTAGTGDPYTAIPRMIAMGAMVSSLLGNIGVAFGMNTTSITSDSFSSESANIGAGSVLGDTSKESESINNALSTLEDFAQPQYQTLLSMNNYLETIANNIGGVTSLLIRQGGFAFGEGYEGFDTGFKNNISLNDITLGLMSPIDSIISKIPVIGQVNDLFGSVVNSVLGGVFGKTSVSQSMTDSGIYFADQLLTQAIEDFNGSAYQTIQTTVTKKSWFSKSSSTTINTYFQDLDDEIERQFSLVLSNLYNTVLIAGQELDATEQQIEDSLSDFVVSIGKISLKDKTGEEIQETLTAVFGEIADDMAETAFPLLTEFQQIGEGTYETLTRVAAGMEEAEFYISRLGNEFDDLNYLQIINKQGDIGFEALLQSITAVEEATYPTNNGLLDIVENLDATAEELYTVYIALDELRDRLIFLGQVAEGLSSSMIYGAGSVEALDSGFNAFFENFLTDSEQLTYQTQQITDEFSKLGLALPTTKDSFKELLESLDLTTESGQELYGRLIILSESFADVADKTAESISNLEDELKQLTSTGLTEFSSGIDSIFSALRGLNDIATSFINSFSTSSLGNTREQIIEYNELRKEFEGMFDSTGKLNANVTEEEAKDLYSELSVLGTAIGKSQEDLQKDLVSQFETDLSKLEMSEEILKVDVVSGLADLLGLNESQKAELQNIAKDGNIAKDELNSIKGLTETQKNGILDFAKNSTLFSTEETLSSLNAYMKKQLEVLQKTQAEETATLSKQTLTYGDYIGKQEQIDIAKLLGVSYETAQPLIEQLQGLSVSKNPTSDLEKILGYTGEGDLDYNKTTASQVSSLSPYITGVDVGDVIKSVDTNIAADKEEEALKKSEADSIRKEIADLNSLINANFALPMSQAEITAINNPIWKDIMQTNWDAHNAKWGIGWETNRTSNAEREALLINTTAQYKTNATNTYLPQINQLQSVLDTRLKGYAVGAVNIPNDQIAQIHQKEMIIPATFAEGLRNGDLTLSANTPNINLGNINLFEGVQDIMENIYKSLDDFPKKTFDLLDDVINGRSSVRVEQI